MTLDDGQVRHRRFPRTRRRKPCELLRHAREQSTRSPSTRSTMRSGCDRGYLPSSRMPIAIRRLLEQGALTFVIVGAGATGTEISGALAELIRDVMPSRVPGPRRLARQDRARRSRAVRARPVLPESARLRREGAPARRRRAPAGDLGEGGPSGCRGAIGRRDDPDPMRDLGRRPAGGRARLARRPRDGTRRPDRRAAGPHRRRSPAACTRWATSPTSAGARRQRLPSAGFRGPAGRTLGGEEHPGATSTGSSGPASTTTTRASWR